MGSTPVKYSPYTKQETRMKKKSINIMIDGVPVEKWAQDQKELEEAERIEQERTQAENIPRYKKPRARYKVHKVENGTVRHLTKEEIMSEYGLDAMGEMTTAEKIIFVLKEQQEHNLSTPITVNEIAEKMRESYRVQSISGIMSTLYSIFGEEYLRHDAFLARTKNKQGAYVYYLTFEASGHSYSELYQLYKDLGRKKREEEYEEERINKLTEPEPEEEEIADEPIVLDPFQSEESKVIVSLKDETVKELKEDLQKLHNKLEFFQNTINNFLNQPLPEATLEEKRDSGTDTNINITFKVLFGWIKE